MIPVREQIREHSVHRLTEPFYYSCSYTATKAHGYAVRNRTSDHTILVLATD